MDFLESSNLCIFAKPCLLMQSEVFLEMSGRKDMYRDKITGEACLRHIAVMSIKGSKRTSAIVLFV